MAEPQIEHTLSAIALKCRLSRPAIHHHHPNSTPTRYKTRYTV